MNSGLSRKPPNGDPGNFGNQRFRLMTNATRNEKPTPMNTIQKLHERGQSVWCDNLSRKMIDSGELRRLIDLGVVGITSNPTIFMKAITGGDDYDNLLPSLSDEDLDVVSTYERLALPDIAGAAD